MKKYLLILLSLGASAIVLAQDSLCIKLDSLLMAPMFDTSQVGMMVYDLTDDKVLFERNARQTMRPASTMKLLTAATALDHLGSNYQLQTRLFYTGIIENGKLTGDIYCVGGFDPMVSRDDIRAFAEDIHQLGVDTLQGGIYADLSMKEPLDYGEGWCWDDKNPKLTPLSVGRDDNFIERLMQAMLLDSIVFQQVQIGERVCPAEATFLSTRSHSIDQVLLRMMKKSDNFYAEALFYQIAKAISGRRTATADDARTAMRYLIRRIGLNDNLYRFADGCGLSLYNYLSAEMETMLLRFVWRNNYIYSHLYPTLPIAGVDGTLEKRMNKTAAKGNVRAKTGTLTGISSLAGYCTAANGHQLAFCIINQGVLRGKDGRDFQDRVCKLLCEPWETMTEE
ncbi:MAG: D-alanyl-D-alanine carboxypeptidase/D-alanyl-D-alanine-endopeptidase [Prevotella sp.]|nr:D-alanyl-D-alanine carboxypeptidase/D-alanyl-D-alanine-endopeptidase [Prevotella sp.]